MISSAFMLFYCCLLDDFAYFERKYCNLTQGGVSFSSFYSLLFIDSQSQIVNFRIQYQYNELQSKVVHHIIYLVQPIKRRIFCLLSSSHNSQIIYPTSFQRKSQRIPFPFLISLPSSKQTAVSWLYIINSKSNFQHVYYFKPTYNTQQRISMETEQDFKKQYDEMLATYSKRKTDNAFLLKNIDNTDSNIANLTTELNSYTSNTGNVEVKQDLSEINALCSKIEQLENQIKQKQADINHGKTQFSNAVSQLSNEGKQHRQLNTESQAPSAEELNAINNQVTQAKRAYEEEACKVQSLRKEISDDQHNLKLLEAELAELSKSESEASHYKADESNLELEKELKQLNKQLESLSQTVANEQKNADSEKKKLQQSIKTEKAALTAETNKVNELKQQQKSLQEKLASNENDKLNLLQGEVKKLQNQNQQLQKDIDRLTQSIQTKKAEKAAQQEQLRKYKEKKEKNYKSEIIEAEKTTINLHKELQREKEKLAEVAKLSKSYVNQENLQILQKELNRHQSSSIKTSIETEENKLKKYLKENQNLKTRIQTLKSASRKLEQQTENIVRILKQSGDELVKDKLAQQKVFNQSTNKLNQYMKEYPDHEKKKEQQKLEEKKRRAEEKEKLREAAREEKEKKKQEQLKTKQTEKIADNEGNPNLPAWEKWDKWEGKNLPAKDQTSIFNNRQFQLAAGAIALLSILLITFG